MAEITGKSERTLRRYLVEDGHAWSETVKTYIGLRHNYGTMLEGEKERTVIVATVLCFFPWARRTLEEQPQRVDAGPGCHKAPKERAVFLPSPRW